jgi:hypothetical protein
VPPGETRTLAYRAELGSLGVCTPQLRAQPNPPSTPPTCVAGPPGGFEPPMCIAFTSLAERCPPTP